jgi:cytosine/adenosine deaminase-related metal-dependent hydrolase
MPTIAIHADWIFSLTSSPMPNAWLVAQDGTIAFLGHELPMRFQSIPKLELPNTAILPGLINSHCHLEFSDMADPIQFNGSFIAWIQSVVQYRALADAQELTDCRQRAIARGIDESYQAGTRVLLDTITAPWSLDWIQTRSIPAQSTNSPEREPLLRALIGPSKFYVLPIPETLDINASRGDATIAFARHVHDRIADLEKRPSSSTSPSTILPRLAVSPHAPYTASPNLVRFWAEWSKSKQGILSMHLAESREEMEWLAARAEPIESALARFRDQAFERQSPTIRELVDAMLDASLGIIAHGNYLDDSILADLSAHRNHVAIAHCPRTYRHFHPDRSSQHYPLAERLHGNVRHLLGTDSRASNPDLSIWSEMQTLLSYPNVSGEQIIAMATQEPADLLGLDDFGTLAAGKRSLCTAIPLDGPLEKEDIYRSLLKMGNSAIPLESMVHQS